MKLLCAICACWWREDYTNWQRQTWATQIPGIDVKFFFGRGWQRDPQPDEVFLDCADNYKGLPEKVQKTFQWALDNGYDWTFKTDDDIFVVLERLKEAVPEHDYVGRYWEPSHGFPYGFVSGAAYWISSRAMDIVSNSLLNECEAEDRWVAGCLGPHDIIGKHDGRYKLTIRKSDPRNTKQNIMDYPRIGNKVISVGEFSASEMLIPFNIWNDSMQKLDAIKSKMKWL